MSDFNYDPFSGRRVHTFRDEFGNQYHVEEETGGDVADTWYSEEEYLESIASEIVNMMREGEDYRYLVEDLSVARKHKLAKLMGEWGYRIPQRTPAPAPAKEPIILKKPEPRPPRSLCRDAEQDAPLEAQHLGVTKRVIVTDCAAPDVKVSRRRIVRD